MPREYKMRKRAEASRKTRERILQAAIQLHDAQGVAPTTLSDIAKRAGLGQATLYRHFPTLGDLVHACGAHVWQEMCPPTPDTATAALEGLACLGERLEKLVKEIDAFYRRGALRLGLAGRDRELIPELEYFLRAVEAGVEAYVKEALAPSKASNRTSEVIAALLSFPVWSRFMQLDLSEHESRQLTLRMIQCAMGAVEEL